jgi:hypothetical protein
MKGERTVKYRVVVEQDEDGVFAYGDSTLIAVGGQAPQRPEGALEDPARGGDESVFPAHRSGVRVSPGLSWGLGSRPVLVSAKYFAL